MAPDSELDYIKAFLEKIHTTHTVATIETTRNINIIEDAQSILVYTGEILDVNYNIIEKQYKISYKDATEGALNSTLYALINGINKLNKRETITDYTKPNSLLGMKLLSTTKDWYNIGSSWYANATIVAWWITE